MVPAFCGRDVSVAVNRGRGQGVEGVRGLNWRRIHLPLFAEARSIASELGLAPSANRKCIEIGPGVDEAWSRRGWESRDCRAPTASSGASLADAGVVRAGNIGETLQQRFCVPMLSDSCARQWPDARENTQPVPHRAHGGLQSFSPFVSAARRSRLELT